jgi:glucose-6-phosphate isomerase
VAAGTTAKTVELDYTGCLSERVGSAGFDRAEIGQACAQAADAVKALRQRLHADLPFPESLKQAESGFDAALDDGSSLKQSQAEGRRLAKTADTLIVVGIGGSALGALALETALSARKKRLVILDNVDPESVGRKLADLDPRRTAVNVITKSGETAETMSCLLVVLDWMKRNLGPSYLKRVSATTTTDVPAGKEGDLLVLARRLGIPVLGLAKSVGGRFSVLTPVGFVPAAFLGIDVAKVVDGARAMRTHCWSAPPDQNMGVLGAVLLHGMATRRARNIQVLMPYADALIHLVDWYRQLWAESLGKRTARNGSKVETGQTPVLAIGATDQHSQVQLYMEGPHDKIVTFLEVKKFRKDVKIPKQHKDLSSLGYLGGRTLGELLSAEKHGIEVALTDAGRPNLTYRLPEISPHTLGQLLYLFEFQTGLSGELYGVNPYDQPGVLAGKIATYALMGRKGYEKEAEKLRKDLARPPARV